MVGIQIPNVQLEFEYGCTTIVLVCAGIEIMWEEKLIDPLIRHSIPQPSGRQRPIQPKAIN